MHIRFHNGLMRNTKKVALAHRRDRAKVGISADPFPLFSGLCNYSSPKGLRLIRSNSGKLNWSNRERSSSRPPGTCKEKRKEYTLINEFILG